MLYLSAPDDDKTASTQQTPEGHAVRLDATGRVTRVSVINAKWLLKRDGLLVATLRDGRRFRLARTDVASVMG